MSIELENLRRALTSPEKKSPFTIENYLIVAKKFLNFTGDKLPPTKGDLKRFFAQQKERGITPGSQNFYFFVLKKLYEANSWLWPLSKKDRPEIPESLPTTAFTIDEIKTLIKNRGNYSKEERFYLALATTFGMSRLELAGVDKNDIKNGKLHIKSIQHGKGRWAMVPDEIMPALTEYHPRELSVSALSLIFKRILSKSGFEKRRGCGWFSIRVALLERLRVALAQNELPISWADDYLRFRERSIGSKQLDAIRTIIYRDIEGTLQEPYALDKIILQVHPFISFWQS